MVTKDHHMASDGVLMLESGAISKLNMAIEEKITLIEEARAIVVRVVLVEFWKR
jgi:hypothetical protein